MRNSWKALLGPTATAVAGAVLIIGTWANFALPYWPTKSSFGDCYFGDALIVFISCGDRVPGIVETIIEWCWYLTWGWFWIVGFFLPMAPLVAAPLLLLWVATLILAVRWIWRRVRRRAPAYP